MDAVAAAVVVVEMADPLPHQAAEQHAESHIGSFPEGESSLGESPLGEPLPGGTGHEQVVECSSWTR